MMRLRSHPMAPATTAYCEALNATGGFSLSARSVPVCVSPMTPAALATSVTVTTTLYDLIATIQDVVGPGNDRLVVATVVHMLSAGSLILPSALDMPSSTVLSSVADC